jgi:6-phosphogluconolactonase
LSGPNEVSREAASLIESWLRSAIDARGRATIALSGGGTPRETFRMLASTPQVAWSSVEFFWVDERCVPPTDDRSNYHWAYLTWLQPAGIPAANVFRMPAEEPDGEAAARRYEQLIRAQVAPASAGIPEFDVVVLGIGDDGHMASLFPGEPTLRVRDRLVAYVPSHDGLEPRLTLTAPVILQARQCVVMAFGVDKQRPLRRAWAPDGEVSDTPARLLREARGGLTWVVDRAAAGA